MRTDIPALSLREPWCYAVLRLGKTIENRTWRTSYRGRITLHASKTWDPEGSQWLLDHGYEHPGRHSFERAGALGAYVGEVTVVDCCRFSPCLGHDHGAWPFGPICWLLEEPQPFEAPVRGRGHQGLYNVETGVQWPTQLKNRR